MFKTDELIKDDIINKEKLVLIRASFLGIDKAQVEFISKIFKRERETYFFDISEISKIFSTNEETSRNILQNLIIHGYISFFIKDGEHIFDFSNFIKKLLETYLPPNKKSNFKQKSFWIQKNVEFSFTEKNFEILKEILKENEWKDIVDIILNFKDIKINNWSTFKNIFSLEKEKINKNNSSIKKALDKNWLI